MGIDFRAFLNSACDDEDDEIRLPEVTVSPVDAANVEAVSEDLFTVELNDKTLLIADNLGIARDDIERFHEFAYAEFGDDFASGSKKVQKYWRNSKLGEKGYVLLHDFAYARGLQKYTHEFTDFVSGKTKQFQKNLLVRSPHGFLGLEFMRYLLWLLGLYRSSLVDYTKDHWLLSAVQVPLLTTMDIHFLKSGMQLTGAETENEYNLREIYNSPLLCVCMCGDARIDSEIVHEIYTYRTAHLQTVLSCFVVLTNAHLDLYNSDRYFGDMWKEMVVNIDDGYTDSDEKDTRLRRLTCYFKSDRDAVSTLGMDVYQAMGASKLF